MSLVFHASPPAGHWINDPNGLVYEGGAYRLFVQHRGDGPAFRETGWARFTSADLLRWTFDGSVIPPVDTQWAYSGSVQPTASGLDAIYTAHDAGLERQVRRTSIDAGLTWTAARELEMLGRPSANSRDPYVFRDGDEWGLLLAKPCDWREWAQQPPSRLQLYRSPDGNAWRHAGTIGPWRPAGVMWEVPVLARLDGQDVLFISEVDRRGDGADCTVRAWIGQLTAEGFVRHPGVPAEGQRVDQGPDFYALMGSAARGWPEQDQAFVAWLSNWQTARTMSWGAFAGGPISLPRTLSIEGPADRPRLSNRPLPAIDRQFSRSTDEAPVAGKASLSCDLSWLTINVTGESSWARVEIDWIEGVLVAERGGDQPWQRRTEFVPGPEAIHRIDLFLDGPVLELFLIDEGISMSMALASQGTPYEVTVAARGTAPAFHWSLLKPSTDTR